MTALKARDVAGFLRKPDFSKPIFLVYGPDRGLVVDSAATIIGKSGIDSSDPFALVRIDENDAGNNDRLITEAHTVGMFAGKRLLRVRVDGTDRGLLNQIEALLLDPPVDCTILLEAGDLKKSAPLRTLVEKASLGVAIPCYSDGPAAIHALIDEYFPPSEGWLDADARKYVAQTLESDRGTARAELEKLRTFAGPPLGETLSLADVSSLIGDPSEADINGIVDAVISGDIAGFDSRFGRFQAAGLNVNTLLFSLQRQFNQLDQLRHAMDANRMSAGAAIAGSKPPIFFGRRRLMETALMIWTRPAIAYATRKLRDCVLQSRLKADLASEITHMTLLSLAIAGKRRR